jgi:hypothetical protein
MAKLEETEMQRKVNVIREQKETDLFTLTVFSAPSSYLKLEK